MNRTPQHVHCARAPRRGLAPLEFVLWLPILLGVMAMMVNLGTMTGWRLRGEIVARDATWRARFPRDAANEPRPENHVWPQPAVIDLVGGAPRDQISQLDDPEIDHPVVRGPLPNGFVVEQVLNPATGGQHGVSSINRSFPLMSKLGRYQSGNIEQMHLERRWQASEMRIPNVYRRTVVLYQFPKPSASLKQTFDQASNRIHKFPREPFYVLYQDDDYIKYTGGAPDFRPRISPNMCETDPDLVEQTKVEPLIGQIAGLGDMASAMTPAALPVNWLAHAASRAGEFFGQRDDVPTHFIAMLDEGDGDKQEREDRDGDNEEKEPQTGDCKQFPRLGEVRQLPYRMTSSFLSMYKSTIERFKQQIKELQMEGGPGSAAQIRALEAEIEIIKPKIEQLEAFRKRLKEKGYWPCEKGDNENRSADVNTAT